tara:strand:+ start:202 stop:453 length:252 start_codon:yes stop_codon:yes gene_type:complete
MTKLTKLETLERAVVDTEAVAAAAYSDAYNVAYSDYYASYGDSVYAEAEAEAHADAQSGTAYDDCFKAKLELAKYLKEQDNEE